MIELPTPCRRVDRRAFQLAIGVLAATVVTLVASPWLGARAIGAGAAAFVVLLIAGFVAPRFLDRAYDAWNRVALLVARVCRLWITAVLFGVVGLVGIAGSRLPLGGEGHRRASWRAKPTVPREAYRSQGAETGPSSGSWLYQLSGWSIRSRNEWTLLLVPLLAALRLVHGQTSSSLSAKNYTLY